MNAHELVKLLQWPLWMVGLTLQSLLIAALLQGAGRQFPAMFTYVVCLLGTTTVDIIATLAFGTGSSSFKTYYWSAELIRQTALFALVASLTAHAVPAGRRADTYGRTVSIVAVVVWVGSVLLYYDDNLNAWMTALVRNLSFLTGIMNLGVWFAYARAENRDILRLMIAAGLGLQMTGEAIGQAIRLMNFAWQTNLAASLFIVLAHFLCLFIWWRAFQTTTTPQFRHST